MIERTITPDILKDLRYFPVVGIMGPRQSGKTTLAKSLMEQTEKETVYLDLESESDRYLLQDPETYLLSQAEKCVIIDEVQMMPRLFPLLRSVIDRRREPARFILSGSASPELVRNSSESLAGRIAFHELSPFSLEEVSPGVPMRLHWLRGGYPLSTLAPDEETAARWLDSYLRSFIERDLRVVLKQDIEPENMRRFLGMLSHLHGEVLNVSALANSLGIATATVNKYLDLLEGAFWIARLQPWYVNIGKRLVKAPKVYFRDSGMLHRLLGIAGNDPLLSHPKFGASWEGYAVEQIRLATALRWQYYFYRTQAGAETDLFLRSRQGKTWCVEIKASNTPAISKGFYQSVGDLQPDFKFVVVPESQSVTRSDGVTVCNLPEFLRQLSNA